MVLELLIPFVTSFILVVLLMPVLIWYDRRKKLGQAIFEIGLSWHEKKSGTPTMGGLVFNFAIVIVSLVGMFLTNTLHFDTIILVTTLVLYGVVGFVDDVIKMIEKHNRGLWAWQKALLQVILALLFAFGYWHAGFPLSITILGQPIQLGILYVLFIIFWLVGFSNAVNLTDGIDGLVAGQAAIAFALYACLAYYQDQFGIMLFCVAVVGALIGFLIFNHNPAKIFMGDMGSLALGGALAAVSLLLQHPFSLLFIGIIFVIETATVIIQVTYYHRTGKRLFKMTPIHHQFEMDGWNEWKIDTVFWLVGAVVGAITLVVII
ncbi:phospho-N-acetylmuramoyl-pentapeptide-transferase [Ligilactobacillus sp. LYQ60]|uniref:phospho-N-acetylmuramoyl-pentapeptide- transferase n=1 Tax=unclassified Ligilactobacillus TaxID=2767920 RepID=UPI003851D2A9